MNEKRRLLIDTAFNLFYEHGIDGVGINEILKVSGVAKKTLYNHFESKDDLVIETLKERDIVFLTWLNSELQNSKTNDEVIQNLFSTLTKWFHNNVPELTNFRGCYFLKVSGQCSDSYNPIFKYCVEHKQKVRNLIAAYLSGINSITIEQICLLKEGAIITAYLKQDLNVAEKCIPVALELITP